MKKRSVILPIYKPSGSKRPDLGIILYPDLMSVGLSTSPREKAKWHRATFGSQLLTRVKHQPDATEV